MIDAPPKVGVSGKTQSLKSTQNMILAAKGSGITFVGAMFTYGSQLMIGILLARFLGAEQFGLYRLVLPSVVIAASLASLGLGPAMVRYIAQFNGRQDASGIWGVIQVGFGLTSMLSILIGVSLYLLANPIAVSIFNEPRLIPLLRLGGLLVPFVALNEIISAATRGFNKMQYTVIAQDIAQPALKLILFVVVAFIIGLNATTAFIVYSLATVVAFLIIFYFLNKLFSLKRPLQTARRELKQILRFSLPIYLSRLIRTFSGNLQTILLGVFNTVANVGIFSVAIQVSLIGTMFHRSIVTASMPIFSELYDQKDMEQISSLYQTMTKWTFALNLPLFLIVLLFPASILGIFGQDFVGGAAALSILAWGNLINSGTGVCGIILDMTGHTTLKLVNSIVVVFLTLSLNFLLIPKWGLMGAVTAALIVVVVDNLLRLLEVFILYRLVPYSKDFAKPIIAGLVTFVVGLMVNQWYLTEENLIFLVVNTIILFGIYGSVVLILGLSKEDRVLLNRLGQRIGTKFFPRFYLKNNGE